MHPGIDRHGCLHSRQTNGLVASNSGEEYRGETPTYMWQAVCNWALLKIRNHFYC